MCSLYLPVSLHLHACGFASESSVYVFWCLGGCVFFGSMGLLSVGLFLCFGFGYVCGLVLFLDSMYLHLWGLFSVFVHVSVCICLYFF